MEQQIQDTGVAGVGIEVEVAPACRFCQRPAFIDAMCEQHVELEVFIWRLRRRGDPITAETLVEIMQRIRPVTFEPGDAVELYRQYAGQP